MAQLLNTIVDGNLQVTGSTSVTTPLSLDSGGTNATTAKNARKQILGYTPSAMRLTKNSTENLALSDSSNYHKASYGTAWIADSYGDLFVKKTATMNWEGTSNSTVTGIMLSTGAPAGYVRVFGTIRYLKTKTTAAHVQTAIARDRDGSYTNLSWISGTYDGYTNHRISHTLNQIIYMEPGDIVFLGTYKSVQSLGLEILTDYTKWGVEYIATD